MDVIGFSVVLVSLMFLCGIFFLLYPVLKKWEFENKERNMLKGNSNTEKEFTVLKNVGVIAIFVDNILGFILISFATFFPNYLLNSSFDRFFSAGIVFLVGLFPFFLLHGGRILQSKSYFWGWNGFMLDFGFVMVVNASLLIAFPSPISDIYTVLYFIGFVLYIYFVRRYAFYILRQEYN